MGKRTYGRTQSGQTITDELVEQLAAKAEAGHDVEQIRGRRAGRPAMGMAAASVESVRLEPELKTALLQRAERDEQSTSAVIRAALRRYLAAP